MYLETVKTTTRYWGIPEDEPGAYALHCCAAAGAEQEAQGFHWDPAEAVRAFSEVRRRSGEEVGRELAALCHRHKLPPAALTIRFLAVEAARLEAEAAEFLWGTEEEQAAPELRIAQIMALAKRIRRAQDENGVPVTERG